MIIENGKIYSMKPVLPELEALNVPARVGIQVVRLVKKLRGEIGSLDQARDKLILKYGEMNEQGVPQLYGPGNTEHPISEHWGEFVTEIGELMTAEMDIEFTVLKLPGTTEISIPALLAFEDFIEIQE